MIGPYYLCHQVSHDTSAKEEDMKWSHHHFFEIQPRVEVYAKHFDLPPDTRGMGYDGMHNVCESLVIVNKHSS